MDNFLWWSGVAAWGVLAAIGLLWLGDVMIEWAVDGIWTKRQFLAFVADRLKSRRS